MSRVLELKSEDEWAAAVRETASGAFGGKPMVVDFSASWCGPCKAIGPIFDQLSGQFPQVKFVKVDVDELQEVAQECGIRGMPTFQAYFNGAKVDELVGADPNKLRAMVVKASQMGAPSGPGQKVGGSSAPPAGADDMRARMAAAAEARMKAAQPQ